ncbi:MAG TPA: OFA family MFS transporter [Myxococcales bacterium]|jgi:MFS family permease|nr:OFA family MFS transporter [Myxococcales bacterium]
MSFLDRDRTIAEPGYSRWLVPPAALAIHMCIGQAYAFSVFNLPMTKLIGITKAAPEDWKATTLAYVFSVAIVLLGLSAAVFGTWLERVGPRMAMFASACCFGGGFVVAALGVQTHQFWLVILGYGVIGGVGLGLGYISPVSTLIKWFPDRPGMATGMAIMGFGAGAMVGSPLAVNLMKYFATPTNLGVAQTMVAMGGIYFVIMMFGVFTVRVVPPGWKPAGWTAPTVHSKLITDAQVTAANAIKTPQFWLLWGVLFLNVSAGIGVLQTASPIIQQVMGVAPAAAAGFVGLLSIFNMLGRFFWSSTSDKIGRKPTYTIYFVLGAILYALIPTAAGAKSVPLFVIVVCVIMTMYGGGFATIPAYLRDLFGTVQVGAIHGRLLTAWSAAGVVGPLLINFMRDYQEERGVPKAQAYNTTMYILAGFLVLGFICNALVSPVDAKYNQPVKDPVPSANPATARAA